MDLARMLRQTGEWTPKTGADDRSDPTYGPPQTVRCRKVDRLMDIIPKDGETVTTTTKVMMLDEPALGDLFDGREVVAVESLVAVSGKTLGYAARTR